MDESLTFPGQMMKALQALVPNMARKTLKQEMMTEDREHGFMEIMNLMIDIVSPHLKESRDFHLKNLGKVKT